MTTALLLKIGAESSALRSDLNKANSVVNQFTSKINSAGTAIAGAFTVGAIANFVWNVAELGAKAQGVTSAFQKIPQSTALLQDMQQATEGTVDKLTLMKIGVNAFNNRAPLENLAEILNFIDRTADATDQDFKTLADTMINNIGKQSTKGLNQLGLNIQAIKEKSDSIGFVPALMEEIRRKSQELGDVNSVEADRIDRVKASWKDYTLSLGEAANETGVLGTSLQLLTDVLDGMSGKNKVEFNASDLALFIREDISGKIKDAVENLKELREKAGAPLKINIDALIEKWELTEEQATKLKQTIAQINGITSKAEEQQRRHNVSVQIATEAIQKYKGNLDEITKAYKDIGGGQEVITEAVRILAAEQAKKDALIENEKNLTEKLNTLNEEKLLLTGAARSAINDEIEAIQKKINKLRELSNAEKGQIKGVPSDVGGKTFADYKPASINTFLLAKQVKPIDQFTTALKFLNDQWMITSTNMRTGQQTLTTFADAWAKVGMVGIDATAIINQALVDTTTGVAMAMGNMLAGVGGFEQIGASLLSGVAGVLQQLGQLAIAAGIGIDGIKKALLTLQPGVAIAAGVALIALSRAISASAANIGGGGNGSGGGGRSMSQLTRVDYGKQIEVTGEIELRGDKIIAAIKNSERKQNRGLN